MRVFTQLVTLVVSMLFGSTFVHAQITSDPSGHWEGTVTMPFGELRIEIDLARESDGKMSGTIAVPDQSLRGLPLTSVLVEGKSVTFQIRGGAGGTFRGTLSADGGAMSGTATSQEGETTFTLARTGAARIAAPPKSAPVSQELEGTWHGTLDVRGGLRVILRLANQADGTSTGTMISVDEGNLELPVATEQKGAGLKITSPVTGSTYTGTLSAEKNEIAGTFRTAQGIELPLTLRR